MPALQRNLSSSIQHCDFRLPRAVGLTGILRHHVMGDEVVWRWSVTFLTVRNRRWLMMRSRLRVILWCKQGAMPVIARDKVHLPRAFQSHRYFQKVSARNVVCLESGCHIMFDSSIHHIPQIQMLLNSPSLALEFLFLKRGFSSPSTRGHSRLSGPRSRSLHQGEYSLF